MSPENYWAIMDGWMDTLYEVLRRRQGAPPLLPAVSLIHYIHSTTYCTRDLPPLRRPRPEQEATMTTPAKTMIGSIVENPYVLFLASWAWGSDPSPLVTPSSCLESLPVLASPCLARLIAKLVGVCIILASCANKAPVIRNIVASRSVAGLSPTAIYGEIILYSNAAFYNVLGGNPFSAYGETFTVLLQTLVVAILFWIYDARDNRGRRDAVFASAAYCAYLFGVFHGERDCYPIRAPAVWENPSFKPCHPPASVG